MFYGTMKLRIQPNIVKPISIATIWSTRAVEKYIAALGDLGGIKTLAVNIASSGTIIKPITIQPIILPPFP